MYIIKNLNTMKKLIFLSVFLYTTSFNAQTINMHVTQTNANVFDISSDDTLSSSSYTIDTKYAINLDSNMLTCTYPEINLTQQTKINYILSDSILVITYEANAINHDSIKLPITFVIDLKQKLITWTKYNTYSNIYTIYEFTEFKLEYDLDI